MDQSLLDEVVRRVVEIADPDRIILFGSAARGQAGPDSDLDLLVIKSDVAHRGHLEQEIYLNFFGLGVPVDVIVVTPEDIERYGNKVGTIIGPALQEGREIYRTEGRQSSLGRKPAGQDTYMPPALRDPTDPEHWLRRARSNLAISKASYDMADTLYEDLCFEAQQAAEKALKALLVQRQVPFPKTHEITELLDILRRSGLEAPEQIRKAGLLTRYAVVTRYPGLAEAVAEEDYLQAVELAERVVRWAESVVRSAPP